MNITQKILDTYPNSAIAIISGEGENGTPELFTGKRSSTAIARRLTKECCAGDRWSTAVVQIDDYSAIDLIDGKPASWPLD